MAATHVWVDGALRSAEERHLSAFDRGFQLGDGVFETLHARDGQAVELDEHVVRLRHSAEGLAIDLPADLEATLADAIRELLRADELAAPDQEAAIRITVSRGAIRERAILPAPGAARPTIVVQAWPHLPPDAERFERGIRLTVSSVRRDPESPLAGLKIVSRADHVFARLEAQRAGADDALFLTLDGYVAEATSANLFLVRGEELATPSLGCGILAGTTRSWLLAWAAKVGLRPLETLLTTREVHEADEAFLSSSVAGVLPVTRFEGRPLGDGRPGPWTRRAWQDRRVAR
ncbi:MAG TPA: aminotransferase class IV [Candidatus Limnocylindrales bacterium]|nr:aminotransferase class IV [Candidatus Limnocylindrales bacterium]